MNELGKLLDGAVLGVRWEGDARMRAERSHDDCDAVIAALIAWAAGAGTTQPPSRVGATRSQDDEPRCPDRLLADDAFEATIARERWMHLPAAECPPLWTDCQQGGAMDFAGPGCAVGRGTS